MAALLTMEMHFPSNWSAEGSVDVVYLDTSSGAESSYGSLAQGATMNRETYEGHRWLLREATSRELLMSVVARFTDGRPFQHIIVQSDSADPLKSALWRMGQSPRELLLPTCELLLKVMSNIVSHPAEPKFRSLKASNASMSAALNLPGVLALLTSVGFEQQVVDSEPPRLTLAPARPMAPVSDALALLKRLDALLKGLSLPRESLSSMQATQQATQAASSSANDAPSHHCHHCRKGIENDLRRKLAGSGEIGGWRTHGAVGNGEYRFHCDRCNVDLCAECYDKYKEGHPTHDQGHRLEIIAPITNSWGGTSYGPGPPAPPPPGSRPRRGPWG